MPRSIVTPRNLLVLSGLCALLVALALLVESLLGDPASRAFLVDKDFANYWIAARAVLDGDVGILFGPHEAYLAHMRAVFGPDYPWHNWSYPPHYLLMIWPLGLFGYGVAMVAFLGLTGALFIGAARAFLGRLDGSSWLFLAAFLMANVLTAQNGFLSGALMLGALALRYERPVLAGVLAGCLTIKPQLGILLPLLFLIEMRWATIAAAAVTTLALAVLSAAVFGVEAWQGYLAEVIPYQGDVMDNGTGIFVSMIPSLFGSLRRWSFDPDTALVLHVVFAVPVLVLAGAAMVRAGDPLLRACIAIVATFLVTPYSLIYDLGPLAAVAIAARTRLSGGPSRGGPYDIVFALLAVTPLLTITLGLQGLPLTPLILLAALVLLCREPLARAVRPARHGAFTLTEAD